MRTVTYMKGGKVLTRDVLDLTAQEQASIDARKVLIAKRALQRDAATERAALRTVALDQLISPVGVISADLKTYAASLDAIIAADAKDVVAVALPVKPDFSRK